MQQLPICLKMKAYLLVVSLFYLLKFAVGEEQDIAPVIYAVEGKEVTLPCAEPGSSALLTWKFHKNGTTFDKDAAQVFPGSMSSVFAPFNSPADRSELLGGSFKIHKILESEEGEYWCEISQLNVPTSKSRKYPVHVYVTPKNPKLTGLTNRTLTEYKKTPVARCTSEAGKPGSKLTWMNGTVPMSGSRLVEKKNAFKSYLTDVDLDLVLESPTRYDHNRAFTCLVEHPAYNAPKLLNYSVLVQYHPINVRVWANTTSLYVFCEAESYPKSTYHWIMPGALTGFTGPSLYVPDLFSLPGGGRFECTASNGISPNATVRMLVDDLRYPDGKPGLAGLEWWVWAAIGGGVLLIVIIIIIIVCCKRKKGDKGGAAVSYKSAAKKPIVKTVERSDINSHPTSLPINRDYRVPDGREDSFDSRTPSPVNEHKQALIDGVFSNQPHDNVALIPRENLRRSQERLFDDDRRNTHASREQLDMVASHISTLNQSWDQLSKSRQALNDAQDELQQINSNLSKSREQLYHSREALNRDTDQNYPYIDEDTGGHSYGRREEQDGYRQPPPAYDYNDSYRRPSEQGYGNYNDGPQYDSRYNDGQQYDDSRGYDYDYQGRDQYDGYNQDYRYDGYDDSNRGYDSYNQRDDNPSSRMI